MLDLKPVVDAAEAGDDYGRCAVSYGESPRRENAATGGGCRRDEVVGAEDGLVAAEDDVRRRDEGRSGGRASGIWS